MKFRSFLLAFALSCMTLLSAEASEPYYYSHQAYIGPEFYRVNRTKEGGTVQTGYLGGVRGGYDYIKRNFWYAGFDGLYASGTMEGHSGEGKKLSSCLTDANLEGRSGYTFETNNCWHLSFTPFLGFGYFWEYNDYQHPSPLKVYLKNTFYYIPVGFLSRIFLKPNLSMGLNFKARLLIDGRTKVTESDVESYVSGNHNNALRYEEKVQYRVDIPFFYYLCLWNKELAFGVVPFYEYRSYGHRANFPYDFLETTFKLYGANIRFEWLF